MGFGLVWVNCSKLLKLITILVVLVCNDDIIITSLTVRSKTSFYLKLIT